MFKNDWDIVVSVGKHRGKLIKHLPPDYMDWVLKNVNNGELLEVRDALVRINNRVGVTRILDRINSPCTLKLDEALSFEPIRRPEGADAPSPQYFGYFIELCLKMHSMPKSTDSVSIRHDEYEERLVSCGLLESEKLVIRPENVRKPTKFDHLFHKAFLAPTSYEALAILAADKDESQYVVMQAILNDGYAEYLENYFATLKLRIAFDTEASKRANSISVGAIRGVIDMVDADTIWDVKACREDDPDSWSRQLYAYWSLYALRYERKKYCKIVNFMTGHVFIMEPTGNPEANVKSWSDLPQHKALFA